MAATLFLEDSIVRQCHEIFNELPTKCKPRDRPCPKAEWIPLSAIAIARSGSEIRVLSLGTGMKCLPAEAIPGSDGIVLHDWHAETIAIRAFNRFLVEECHQMAASGRKESEIIEWSKPHSIGKAPFSIRDDIQIYMYCSEVPCGDASMELVMEAQEDDTPWSRSANVGEDDSLLLGRGSFDKLGLVRRKPCRADSPVTLSKSCSDKIAIKQCMSLLSGPTSLLINPSNAYINTLILPENQYREIACQRAFGEAGRLNPLSGKAWAGGYSFRSFDVKTTNVEFCYSRNMRKRLFQGDSNASSEAVLKASNISTAWIAQAVSSMTIKPHSSHKERLLLRMCLETLVNGRLQGWKEGDLRGASKMSRKKHWDSVVKVLALLSISLPEVASYTGMKHSGMLVQRTVIKAEAINEALKGWIPNIEDNFEIVLHVAES